MTDFRPMLAYNKAPTLRFPMYASVKLDGIRAIVKDGRLLSRTLKPIPNLFTRARYERPEYEGFDGELILGNPAAPDVFNKTTSAVMRIEGAPDLHFYMFDDFTFPNNQFETRYDRLRYQHSQLLLDDDLFTHVVENTLLHTPNDLNDFEQDVLAAGFEGVMLRSPSGPYKYGRSTDKEGYLLKLKRFEDAEARILEVIEKMENTNEAYKDETGRTKRSTAQAGKVPRGTAGALRVVGINGQFKDVEFFMPVGTDANAAALWAARDTTVGRIVCYKFFSVGSRDAPRFPGWKGFRPEEDIGGAE